LCNYNRGYDSITLKGMAASKRLAVEILLFYSHASRGREFGGILCLDECLQIVEDGGDRRRREVAVKELNAVTVIRARFEFRARAAYDRTTNDRRLTAEVEGDPDLLPGFVGDLGDEMKPSGAEVRHLYDAGDPVRLGKIAIIDSRIGNYCDFGGNLARKSREPALIAFAATETNTYFLDRHTVMYSRRDGGRPYR
jgi:hypothetical protein